MQIGLFIQNEKKKVFFCVRMNIFEKKIGHPTRQEADYNIVRKRRKVKC